MKQEKPLSMYNLINWGTAYRGYNALVAGLVMYQYMTNPEAAAFEYLLDITVHTFEAFAPETSEFLNHISMTGNIARGAQAGLGFFFRGSSIPSAANLVDVVNHGMNFVYKAEKTFK